MNGLYLSRGFFPAEFFHSTVAYIQRCQRDDGLIPWFIGGHADPWDHIEAAMGLSIGGQWRAAEAAYRWLRAQQLPDGSWWSCYRDGQPSAGNDGDWRRESNFVAYVAAGVWHHYRISNDEAFLLSMWPTVQSAIHWVLALQTGQGEIHWAVDRDGKPREDALVTGCSSIYKSLECAALIAAELGQVREQQHWLHARAQLGEALRRRPERFDRTWESKARFSMDWFYPVLAGVWDRARARERLQSRWSEFVETDLGCRCVADQPWVTVAESCELTLALLAAGERSRAVELYSWLHQWRADDGSYWTGYQFVEQLLWPEELPTWTAGAILLAADALTEHTAACHLFTRVGLADAPQQAKAVHRSERLEQP